MDQKFITAVVFPSQQLSVGEHLEIAGDQVQVGTLFVLRPVGIANRNLRIDLAQFVLGGLSLLAVLGKIPMQLLVHIGGQQLVVRIQVPGMEGQDRMAVMD